MRNKNTNVSAKTNRPVLSQSLTSWRGLHLLPFATHTYTAIIRLRTTLAAIPTRDKTQRCASHFASIAWVRENTWNTHGLFTCTRPHLKPEGRRVTSETCHRITWLKTEWALITPYTLKTDPYPSSFRCSPQKPCSSHKGSSNQTCVDRQYFTLPFVRPNWAPE